MHSNKLLTKELYDLSRLIKKEYHQSISSFTTDKHKELITTNNAEIMAFLRANKEKDIHPKDIEKVLGIKPSTTTEILNIMENKDLIKKTPSEDDARYKIISLTDKGKVIFRESANQIYSFEHKVKSLFNDEELNNLQEYIGRIKNSLEE